MIKGWIRLHKKMLENQIWDETKEPFDKRSAWIDLLLRANYEDKEIIIGQKLLVVRRGQTFTSILKLAERWKWSKNRVLRYIDLLISLKMLTRSRTHNGTLLTIVNYEVYQGKGYTNETPNGTASGTPSEPSSGTPSGTQIKNIKNNKEYKKEKKGAQALSATPPSSSYSNKQNNPMREYW